MSVENTARLLELLAEKWSPPAKVQEFLKDMSDLMVVAINECTEHMLGGVLTDVLAGGQAQPSTAAPADPRKPPVFKNAICRGSYVLRSACGKCERCAWERDQLAKGL